jgi:hypothetical protein
MLDELMLKWSTAGVLKPRVVTPEEDARRSAVVKALVVGAKAETEKLHARERDAARDPDWWRRRGRAV